jgi:hypothetical protein
MLGLALAAVTQKEALHLAQTQAKGVPEEIFNPGHGTSQIEMALGGILSDSIALCETSTTTIEECLTALEADLDGDWPRLEALFHHQIDCWREIAADLGWQTFSDFVDFPW